MQRYLDAANRQAIECDDAALLKKFAAEFAVKWPAYCGRLCCRQEKLRLHPATDDGERESGGDGDGENGADEKRRHNGERAKTRVQWHMVDGREWYRDFAQQRFEAAFWVEAGTVRRIAESAVRLADLEPGFAAAEALAITSAIDYMRAVLADGGDRERLRACDGKCEIVRACGAGGGGGGEESATTAILPDLCHHHVPQLRRFVCDGPFLMMTADYNARQVYAASRARPTARSSTESRLDSNRVAALLGFTRLPSECYSTDLPGFCVAPPPLSPSLSSSPTPLPSSSTSSSSSSSSSPSPPSPPTPMPAMPSVAVAPEPPRDGKRSADSGGDDAGASHMGEYTAASVIAKVFVWCGAWLHNMSVAADDAADVIYLEALQRSSRAEHRFLAFLRLSAAAKSAWIEWYCAKVVEGIERAEKRAASFRSAPSSDSAALSSS